MTMERPPRGLLDIEIADDEPEPLDYEEWLQRELGKVPDHLRPLLELGLQADIALRMHALQKKGRGRPQAQEGYSTDELRAVICCWVVQMMRQRGEPITKRTTSRRELIRRAREVPGCDELFPQTVSEKRLSRSIGDGMKKLQIDPRTWRSERCEEMLPVFRV